MVTLLVVFAAVMLGVSIKKLDVNEVALQYDVVARRFTGTKGPGGIFAGPPGFAWVAFSSVFKPVDVHVECVTRDGLTVALEVAYQYAPQHDKLEDIAHKYRDADKFEDVVQRSALSAIHLTCTNFNVSDYQNSRPAIQAHMTGALESNLAAIGADGLSTQLVNVATPALWDQAVHDKQQVQQDIQLAMNQRNQSLFEAQNNMALAIQDVLITRQTVEANITAVRSAAAQNATAIVKQYKSLEDMMVGMASAYGLAGPADIVSYMRNQVLRSTQHIDLVMT